MNFSLFGRGLRRRPEDPRIQAAIKLTHQLVDADYWFDPQAMNAKGWQVVPLVWGISEDDGADFLEAARAYSADFIDIDLDANPLVYSVATWTQEALAETRTSSVWRLRISCSQEFAILSQGFEFSFIAGPPEFLKQCLRCGVNKTWEEYLEYAAAPEWTATPRASYDRLAQIYGSPKTIEEFTHIDLSSYAQTSTKDRDRALERARATVEAPGGFKCTFLKKKRWDTIPFLYDPHSTLAEVLCDLSKERDNSGLNVVLLKRGEPADALFIPHDSGVLWRLFLKRYRDQILVYPPSESWCFLKNDIRCHVLAASSASTKTFAQELETSWQDIRDNRNCFEGTIEAQLQYNDIGTRYEVPDWRPFKTGGVEIPSPRKARRSLLNIISDFF